MTDWLFSCNLQWLIWHVLVHFGIPPNVVTVMDCGRVRVRVSAACRWALGELSTSVYYWDESTSKWNIPIRRAKTRMQWPKDCLAFIGLSMRPSYATSISPHVTPSSQRPAACILCLQMREHLSAAAVTALARHKFDTVLTLLFFRHFIWSSHFKNFIASTIFIHTERIGPLYHSIWQSIQ